MYKHRKTLIAAMCGFLAILLIVSLLAMALPGVTVSAADNLSTLQSKKKNLQSQKSALSNELAGIKSSKSSAMSEKSNLDAQLEVLSEQIKTSEELIAALNAQITLKQTEIEQAEQDETDEFDLFKYRVRAMEENGSTSYLGLLLGVDSFSEMLSRLEVINDIMTYDRELMNDLREARERKEQAKADLEANLEENSRIQADLVSQKQEAEEKSNEVDELLKSIQADYEYTASELASLESEISATQKQIAKIEEERKKAANNKYVGGAFLWPLPSPYYSDHITQSFKYRVHQFTGKYTLHGGIDIGCPSGTKIYAANSGKVVISTYVNSYGNYVMIDHGGNVYTLYAHMSKRLVSVGDTVSRGQIIGKVGSTGYSTGAHLHFEIRKNGSYIDPMTQFK